MSGLPSNNPAVLDYESDEGDTDLPDAFVCPITLQIMSNPATDTISGHSFERKTIEEWLMRGKRTNPLTRRPLGLSDLVPNPDLKKKIDEWKIENGYPSADQTVEKEEVEADPIPWYRQKPSIPEPVETFFVPRMVGNSPFMLQLREAQRLDAEFHMRLNLTRRYPYSHQHS